MANEVITSNSRPSPNDNPNVPNESGNGPQSLRDCDETDSKQVKTENKKFTVPSKSVVDKLFNDFISTSNSGTDNNESKQTGGNNSIIEMSALLDQEINMISINQLTQGDDKESLTPESELSKRKLEDKQTIVVKRLRRESCDDSSESVRDLSKSTVQITKSQSEKTIDESLNKERNAENDNKTLPENIKYKHSDSDGSDMNGDSEDGSDSETNEKSGKDNRKHKHKKKKKHKKQKSHKSKKDKKHKSELRKRDHSEDESDSKHLKRKKEKKHSKELSADRDYDSGSKYSSRRREKRYSRERSVDKHDYSDSKYSKRKKENRHSREQSLDTDKNRSIQKLSKSRNSAPKAENVTDKKKLDDKFSVEFKTKTVSLEKLSSTSTLQDSTIVDHKGFNDPANQESAKSNIDLKSKFETIYNKFKSEKREKKDEETKMEDEEVIIVKESKNVDEVIVVDDEYENPSIPVKPGGLLESVLQSVPKSKLPIISSKLLHKSARLDVLSPTEQKHESQQSTTVLEKKMESTAVQSNIKTAPINESSSATPSIISCKEDTQNCSTTNKIATTSSTGNVFDIECIPLPQPFMKAKPQVTKMNLKLKSDVVDLITSGEKVDKNGVRREEGEVSSHSDDDSSKSQQEEDDDSEDDDSKISETGSLPDSDPEKSSKEKKKKKKHKHKKKKHKKDCKEEKSKDRDYKAKRSSGRGHNSRSRSRSRSDSRSRYKSKGTEVVDRGWDAYSYKQEFHKYRRQSRSRSRSRSRHDSYKRDSSKRARSRSRSRSRSKSRSKTEKKSETDLRLRIDKKKLRKIAVANALASLKADSSTGSAELAAIKAGGKSVEELTDFCKGLVGKEHGIFSESESESPEQSDEDSGQPFIHHPFVVREQAPIVMNIRNAKQLPIISSSEKTGVLRSQFPVSSGNQHRLKELEWVPVEKTTSQSTSTTDTTTTVKTSTAPTTTSFSSVVKNDAIPQPSPPVAPADTVFPKPVALPIDISAIVSERLQAVRKLQENPYDMQALNKMHKSQERANQWATSQYQPGQFTGSTGVQILSKEELEGPRKNNKAWLKKDQFKKAEPVKSGIGMFLLQKMGWKAGEGLGKNNEGSLEPLMLDLKVDRKGLQTNSEVRPNNRPGGRNNRFAGNATVGQALPKDLSGKHPVSALLELCNRRKFAAPYFELVHESGPDHKKNFLFKVQVNGVEYQPSVASNNKKTAKMQAATVCLQELGMLPRHAPS